MREADQWLNGLHTMPAHISVAKTAEKLGIAHLTVHRWQVRLPLVHEAARLKGMVEAGRTFFRSS